MQFGYLKRGTHRNTSVDKARYGAAILNDCKYGISVEDGKMRLSLHKGGKRPDYRGDKGVHVCSYGFLPHVGDFDTQNVIRPAYEFNYKPVQAVEETNMLEETKQTLTAGQDISLHFDPFEIKTIKVFF